MANNGSLSEYPVLQPADDLDTEYVITENPDVRAKYPCIAIFYLTSMAFSFT